MHLLNSKLVPLALFSAIIVVIDQIWKTIMLQMLISGKSITLVDNLFSLSLVFNSGAAFGIFPGQRILFLVLPVITVIVLAAIYMRSNDYTNLFSPFGLLLGGAVGNFIDRVRLGCVVDFFDFSWDRYHWPAFNFADVFICLGVVLLFAQILKKEPVEKQIHRVKTNKQNGMLRFRIL